MSDSARTTPMRALQRSPRIDESPLAGRTRLTGRIVTDPAEVAEIARDIERHRHPRWRRAWRAVLAVLAGAGDMAMGVAIFSMAFLALCELSRLGLA